MDIEKYSQYVQFYTGDIPDRLRLWLNKVNWNNLLDLGCGDGALLFALKQAGLLENKSVYAADLSQQRIKLVRQISSEFNCQVATADNLSHLPDNSIDFLITTQVIEHVPDEGAMIKEINRVLAPGGTVYLTTVFKKWYGWYFYRCQGRWVLDPTHLREYTADEQLIKPLTDNGFRVIENHKHLFWYSCFHFFFRLIRLPRSWLHSPWLNWLTVFKYPVLGYYNWELILQKDNGRQ